MVKKCNSNQKENNDKYQGECNNLKEPHVCEKYYIRNPPTCSCQNDKYVGNIIDDSVITCDKIIETTFQQKLFQQKTVPTKK